MNKLKPFSLVLCLVFLVLFAAPLSDAGAASDGVTVEYTVTVKPLPPAGIGIKAVFRNMPANSELQIGFSKYDTTSLDILKDLKLSLPDNKPVRYQKIADNLIRPDSALSTIIATYSIDLSKTGSREAAVTSMGGILSGSRVFLMPANQKVAGARVLFNLPKPWTAASIYQQKDGWFNITPVTFKTISDEIPVSGWYFGKVAFDRTVSYGDGFKVRLLGFKYGEFRNWNVYLNNTPLQEAIKSADLYHKSYVRLKQLFGEFPFKSILVVGPDNWQAGSTWAVQGMRLQNLSESIPHHMTHAYFATYPSGICFNGSFYMTLREGYATYNEGFMSTELTGDKSWRGMLFERKFHYIRGMKFDNMKQNSRQYVLGFIATYLLDREIRSRTEDKKNINDLMAGIWKKFSTGEPAEVSDEQVLEILKELTQSDWTEFYEKNLLNTANEDVSLLNDLKSDFRIFLKEVSDYWYGGHISMYFVAQEIVAAAGDFDFGVRKQGPYFGPGSDFLNKFIIEARKIKDITKSPLTEADIEKTLNKVTGKDHGDFFEYYKSEGFTVDPVDITNFLKTFSFKSEYSDNAVKSTPHSVSLGKTTHLNLEIKDPDFAAAKEYQLQVAVYDAPKGLASVSKLITGKNVSFRGTQQFSNGGFGKGYNAIFSVPRKVKDGKVYTEFDINMPKDSGVMIFTFNARAGNADYNSPDGGFKGTDKVFFQDVMTLPFK